MTKILIVEDDPAVLLGIESAFNGEDFELIKAEDGETGYKFAKTKKPDLIILDIMLPKKNGLDICKELRAEKINIPIIMLTSKKEEIDKVLGFEFGADDYLTKPFSIRELQARIKALLRRSTPVKVEYESFEFGNISLNFKKLEAYKSKKQLQLSAKEFQILKFFIEHEGEVISRDKLLDEVWGYDSFPTTRTVDNYILSLRKRLEDDPSNPKHILTLHTLGYKFVR